LNVVALAISNYEKACKDKTAKSSANAKTGAPVLGFTDLSYPFPSYSLHTSLKLWLTVYMQAWFDPFLGMTTCLATEYSEILPNPKQPVLKTAKDKLAVWIERYWFPFSSYTSF
jgi:hypothetical protein